MKKSEELTDMISDEGIRHFKEKGITTVAFSHEGSKTQFAITKIVLKPTPRIWGREIVTVDLDTGMSHYGHLLDKTMTPIWCEDCGRPITQKATIVGDNRANRRRDKEEEDAKS